ncbi:hypothetical protein R0G64_29515 [Pseudomonas otitidis]|uniref:Glycosyl transferase family 1 n=1 Tax=Metapseudomonas otitidis TaxID=319939 RepID=A0ABU3Y084_9GAMM|nr:hypothetical protein [Pseudomonas otitidis]MDV3443557.1 hypothetical protein [Pseudomonas otitidis]WMR31410.1 hypothetical protein QT513_19735 [Pseudomonas otitidis]
MRVLFIHQNFPGQFRHLVAHLARREAGHRLIACVGCFCQAASCVGEDSAKYSFPAMGRYFKAAFAKKLFGSY